MTTHNHRGFTLVEALLTVVILGLAASVMTSLYFSGLQTLHAQDTRVMFDSTLNSRMQWLCSMKFDQLTSGSDTVTLEGQSYTISWTVAYINMNETAIPEPDAKQITVTLDDLSLTTIAVDTEGMIGKL